MEGCLSVAAERNDQSNMLFFVAPPPPPPVPQAIVDFGYGLGFAKGKMMEFI